jgi:diketogulonate reductase-like aldo/keto reductase
MDKDSTVKLNTGRKMPVLGLGTWLLEKDTADTIAYALELGFPMIDTSGDYGTQPGIARGLEKNGIKRQEIYLVTKVEETDDAYNAAEVNLKELKTSYADLILIHRPPQTGAGKDLWEGLIKAKKDGLARDIGVSNYSTELIERLIESSGETPAVNQIEWSPFGHSEKMKKYCKEKGIIIQAYSPLTRTKRLDDETLIKIAKKYNKTPAQILIRWNLQLETVPLPKANQKDHLKENIDVFDFEIKGEDINLLNGLNERYSSLGYLPYS